MDPATIVLIILGAAAILFFTELIPLPVTAMLVPISLNLAGVIPADEAFKNFGNKWVVLFMAMFVVGEGIFRTGLADRVGRIVIHAAGTSKARLVVMTMLAVGIMSGFLSNTGTVAVFIPLVVGVAASAKLRTGLLLMPMAFAASLGGTMTVIGTPPNGAVNSAIEDAINGGHLPAGTTQSFGFFEFGKIGLIFLAAGILYYAVIGHRFLAQSEGELAKEHQGPVTYRTSKKWHALSVFILVILVMALTALKETYPVKFDRVPGVPLQTAAMLGACLMVITRCVTMKEAFSSISWTTIFLLAGMLSMSTAMRTSGAAELVADFVVTRISHPHALLAATFAITAIVTNFMSNTATATLMAPLGIAMAVKMGVNPTPILMGVAMAASCCFLTPIATPPNTMILGPGGYKFRDYIKAGWPLQVICFIIGVALIPLLWPF
jgi:anion transporter